MAQRGRPKKNPETLDLTKTESNPFKVLDNAVTRFFSEREEIKFKIASEIVKIMVEKQNGKSHADMVPNALKLAEGLIVGSKTAGSPEGLPVRKPNIFLDGLPDGKNPEAWLNDDEDEE